MQRDCWLPHTWLSPCTCAQKPAISPFLLIAKMARTQHLNSGRARERGRKGRKLPGEVLQCFKNLSSHSAELCGMNNRFGTWPACTRESVTAALLSRLPAFDGCGVSQNSWRRGAPAALETEGKKQQTKSKSRGFFVRQTHGSGLCQSQTCHLCCGLWCPALRGTSTAVSAPMPRGVPGSRCNTTPWESPAPPPSQGVHHFLQLLMAFFQWRPPPWAPPVAPVRMSGWEAPKAYHSVTLSVHQSPGCTLKVDWMATLHYTLRRSCQFLGDLWLEILIYMPNFLHIAFGVWT